MGWGSNYLYHMQFEVLHINSNKLKAISNCSLKRIQKGAFLENSFKGSSKLAIDLPIF